MYFSMVLKSPRRGFVLLANNRDASVTSDVMLQAHLWRQISGIEVYEEKVKCKGLMDFLGSLDKKSKAEQVEVRAGRPRSCAPSRAVGGRC